MRAVIQRVKSSSVTVDGETVGSIGPGLMVLLGVAADDQERDAALLASKIINLRVFEDDQGKMNLSLLDTGGEMLVVSQFTLLADCSRGRRPSFIKAAGPDTARPLYRHFTKLVRQEGVTAATGRFGAMMDVALVNDGPVTLILESR